MRDNCNEKATKGVIDILKQIFKGAEFIDLENQNNEVEKHLDTLASIDYLMKHEGFLYGIALRIKTGTYEDFTIRNSITSGKKTEKDKLLNSVHRKSLKPSWHIQGFKDENEEVTKVAITLTDDLIRMIKTGKYTTGRTFNASFLAITFKDLIKNKANIIIYENNEYKYYSDGELEKQKNLGGF